MLLFEKLLCKHFQIMCIFQCLNRDPQTNTGATSEVQILAYKYIGKMFNNLLLEVFNATICKSTVVASSEKANSRLV